MFFSLFLTVLKFQLECNTVSCDFDGGDCQDWTSSYSNCFPTGTSKSIDCFHLFNNSRCDADCNTSGCLFDGGDCQENSVSVQFGPFVIGFQWKWKEKLEFSGAIAADSYCPFHRCDVDLANWTTIVVALVKDLPVTG